MKILIFLALFVASQYSLAAEENDIGLAAHNMFDNRISLGLSTKVKHRLLVNMRTQLQAAQKIVGLLAEGNFEKASRMSRMKFGLSDEMKQIYDISKNDDFRNIGLAFYNSAAELDNVLQTKDMKKSLQALSNTMGYCVQCHGKYRE